VTYWPVTKQLAGLLGGKLTLISEPGKGSVFSLNIPVGRDTIGQARLDRHSVSHQDVGAEDTTLFFGRVLVAEDVKTNQKLMELMLTRMGLEVTLAEDGKQAVQWASSQSFDLIFMDMQMPHMNGYEATQARVSTQRLQQVLSPSRHILPFKWNRPVAITMQKAVRFSLAA
jgi:hypothetical protein